MTSPLGGESDWPRWDISYHGGGASLLTWTKRRTRAWLQGPLWFHPVVISNSSLTRAIGKHKEIHVQGFPKMEIPFLPSKMEEFWHFVVTHRVANFLPKLIGIPFSFPKFQFSSNCPWKAAPQDHPGVTSFAGSPPCKCLWIGSGCHGLGYCTQHIYVQLMPQRKST